MPAVVAAAAITGAIGAGTAVYGAKKSSSAARAAAQYQEQQARYAADLEAKAAADALAFSKEQEAARHSEFTSTQDRNYQMYLADQAREDRRLGIDDERYNARINRLNPYTQWGYGAIGQIMKRPDPTAAGSIGALISR